MLKRYLIAGLTVDMDVSGRTYAQAAPYEIQMDDAPADITLEYDAKSIFEKNATGFSSVSDLEYFATGIMFARRILNYGGYYLHSSSVVLDGRAYLFTAASGTGKSTHTEKWCRLFGAHYLNDDKPVLRLQDGVWMAYGTPWSGKNDLSSNEGVPVGGIACLNRGEENTIAPMPSEEAVPFLMSQTVFRLLQEQMEMKLALLDKLLRQVPVWELYCRNDDDAAYVAHSAMTR